MKEQIKNGIRRVFNIFGLEIKKAVSSTPQLAPELPPHLIENCKMCVSREEVLKLLPKEGVIAEVGVAYGDFTALLLETLAVKKLYAIDTFAIDMKNELWNEDVLQKAEMSHLAYYKKKFQTAIENDQLTIMKGYSWDMLAMLPDKSLDYIYIDAGHGYDSVKKDSSLAIKKIKEDGILQFNDYCSSHVGTLDWYGVPKAVNELMIDHQLEMLYFCLSPYGSYDVVLRRKK